MITTDIIKPRTASVTEKCAVLIRCLISKFNPPSNIIIINASAAKYGTTSITASGCIIPNTGPIITPRIIKNATSGIPVFLKNASPATPRKITTPAASNITGADAIGPS
jgi:hypothetical protein